MFGQANYTGEKQFVHSWLSLTILKNLIPTNVFVDGKLKR